jgi:hypothetical protein
VQEQFSNASLDQHMIAMARTPISIAMLLIQSVEDSVEMDSLFIQIQLSQITKNAMKFQIMLLISVMMQVSLLTSQPQR